MPFNLGFGEVLIILVVVLLLFGAKRIPEIAGSLGKGINSFKKNLSEVENSVRGADTEFKREYERRPDSVAAGEPLIVRPDDAQTPEPKRLLS